MTDEPDPGLLLATLRRLDPLVGVWRGAGQGAYPTIEPFEYDEELRFELRAEYPMIAYEQRTVLSDGEVSHWEAGLIRPVADGVVEVSNAQLGGRVEVLRGEVPAAGGPLELVLRSVHLGHDPRLVESGRVLRVDGDRLEYEASMATTTSERPELQTHLRARLVRLR